MSKIVTSDLITLLNSLCDTQKKDVLTFFSLPQSGIIKKKGHPNPLKLIHYLLEAKNEVPTQRTVLQIEVYGKPIDLNSWKLVVTQLYHAISKFIVLLRLEDNPLLQSNEVIGHLLSQGQLHAFEKLALKQIQQIQMAPRNFDFHYHLFAIYQKLEIYHKDTINETTYLESMHHHLHLFQLENKLRLLCEMRHRAFADKLKFELSAEQKMTLIQAEHSEDIVIKMYWSTYQLLNEWKDEQFENLKSILDHQNLNFTRTYLKPLYEYLLIYCINEVKKENVYYANDYLEIIEIMEEKELLLEKAQLSWQRFKNIVTAHLYSDRMHELEKFITQYSHTLDDKHQSSATALAHARLLFNKRRPKQAIDTIRHIEFKNPKERIEYDKLILKIEFQLMKDDPIECEAFIRKIESTRKYIYRNKKKFNSLLNEEDILRTENFIFHTRKLAKKAINDRTLTQRFKSDIMNAADKIWLKQQVKKKIRNQIDL